MSDFDMPSDLQYKDELRKEMIKIEEQIELIENKEYEKLRKEVRARLKKSA